MKIVFDSSEKGLRTIMREYQDICMRFLWERGEEGVNTAKAWLHINKILIEEEKSISRASIINFLKDMNEKGILNYREKPAKGGYHRIYTPIFDEAEFKEHIARQIIEKLLEEFPDETNKVIRRARAV